jgi:hypothetical protein
MLLTKLVSAGSDPATEPLGEFQTDHVPDVGDEVMLDARDDRPARRYRVVRRTYHRVEDGGTGGLLDGTFESLNAVTLDVEEIAVAVV